MEKVAALAKWRNFIKLLKRSLRSRNQKHQLSAINLMKETFTDRKYSAEALAESLNDEDLIEIMADALSTLGLERGEYLSSCFLRVANSKKFFKPSQASYIIQCSLRLFNISSKQAISSPTGNVNLQLILTILRRLLDQNVKLTHVCETLQSSLLQLCRATLKHKQKDKTIILNCCFVVVALLSEAINSNQTDINELIFVARIAAMSVNSLAKKQSMSEKRDSIYLFSRLSYLLLRASSLKDELAADEEEVLIFIHTVTVNLSIPYLKVITQECKNDEEVIKAILFLIREWLLQKREVKSAKKMHSIIVTSGLFSSLALLRKNNEIQKQINYILSEVIILFFEHDLCSPSYSSSESEKIRENISNGFNTLPIDILKWSKVLLEQPSTKSFAVLFFYCVHYTSVQSVSLRVFSVVCHFIRKVNPKDLPKPLLKALWFLFVLLYSNCERSKRSKVQNFYESQNALIQLLTDVDSDLSQIFVHHRAMLLWAFSSSFAASPFLQEKVVDLWLLKLNTKSLLDTKMCCQASKKISICVLRVLFHTKNSISAKRAKKIFESLLVCKPSEYLNVLWEMSFIALKSESIEELNALSVISLLIQFPLENMDFSQKLSCVNCLISFWERCQMTAHDRQHLISKTALLLLNLLTAGAPVPPLIVTDAKLLKLIEKNLQSSDACVFNQTAHLFMFLLTSLPADFQVECKVNIDLSRILENVFAESEKLSTVSISLLNLVFEPQLLKFISFVPDQSFHLLRTLYLHLQLLIMKNSVQSTQAIWKCMSLVLDQCKKLNSRKLISHLVTQSMTPTLVTHFFSITDNLQDLFKEGFLKFLVCWFHCINQDKLIMHLLIFQRRTASHFVMPLHQAIMKSCEKFIQFVDELDLNALSFSYLPLLRSLASILSNFKHVIPESSMDAIKSKVVFLNGGLIL